MDSATLAKCQEIFLPLRGLTQKADPAHSTCRESQKSELQKPIRHCKSKGSEKGDLSVQANLF